MKLSLDALQVMDAIDRNGSFAAAADELHRVPSALTYTVQKLEQDLDVLLFNRAAHRAVLTAPGRELLEQGRHLLRAAEELECRVKRLASGWETDLRIAIDTLIPAGRFYPVLEEFYREQSGTRIRLSYEVLGGSWDALMSNRADLVIGASGDGPSGGGYSVRPLGEMQFVFAVSPAHALAQLAEPLTREDIMKYRAVAVGDSSRNLPPRSVGLLTGQDVLTVPDMRSKLAAQVAGLGCGYLPLFDAMVEVGARRLVIKETEEPRPDGRLHYVWRPAEKGKALRWFLKKLEEPTVRTALLDAGALPAEAQAKPPRARRSA